jgi:SAM-dependent methyltransferase
VIASNKEKEKVLVTVHNFNERDYLTSNPGIAKAIREGIIESARKHFYLYGRYEGRKMKIDINKFQQLYAWIINALYIATKGRIPRFLEIRYRFIPNSRREWMQVLETRINDLEILVKQMQSIFKLEGDVPPPPPKHLQIRVVGSYVPGFIESGFTQIYPALSRVLQTVGKELGDFQFILDWGCGCGRAIRALAKLVPNSKLYGTDIDGEAIEWLKQNYFKFAEFSVAPHFPPTPYKDHTFDLIIGISVLTHLPEEMQFQWLKELNRITKPSGYVILTTHGEKHYKGLDASIVDIMNKKGFFYFDAGFNYGKSISLPEFYQTAFHSHAYIYREWKTYFNIIDIQTLGMDNHQDTILLYKSPHNP